MHSPTIVFLSIVIGFLTCSDTTMRTSANPEKPSQVVGQYVSFARAGEFDKLEAVTALQWSPDELRRESDALIAEARKERANSGGREGAIVIPNLSVGANATLEWVRGDFAKSIHDQRHSIKSITKETLNANEARVEAFLGNEKRVDLIPWAFLLKKVENKWKIYDITTEGVELPRANKPALLTD